ncbi:hypothetical protein N8291_05540 [Pseudomonadales bacterium]|nr:hypothetical protein [Pseudomonadales bacterium]MDC3343968.1 hypothetical protein [Pseudomonadales bacterium]
MTSNAVIQSNHIWPNTYVSSLKKEGQIMIAYQVVDTGRRLLLLLTMLLVSASAFAENRWLAGDHHIHSHFSPGYDYSASPPRPVIGGDAVNSFATNATIAKKYNGSNPAVSRIDLIVGSVGARSADLGLNSNTSTRVIGRFTANNWRRAGEFLTMRTLITINESMYLRVRGTNTKELEPTEDPAGENPWDDLWFYTNPVFVTAR